MSLSTGAQLQTFPYRTASKSFLHSNAFMAKLGAQSLTFKSVTDKQTNGHKRFWPPRRQVKSEPHQTWHGDRGPRARSCISKTFGVWCIVSPLGGAENMGITAANASWNGVQTLQIFWKSHKGYTPVGHLYSTFWWTLSKNFSFGGPVPLFLHRWGWNLAWSNFGPPPALLHAKFHPWSYDLIMAV